MTASTLKTHVEKLFALAEQARELQDAGRLQEAEALCRQALALADGLSLAHPDDDDLRAGRALAHERLGLVCAAGDRTDEAEAAYREALALQQELAKAHPDRAEIQDTLARFCQDLGYFYVHADRGQDAKPYFRHAQAVWARLAREHPEHLDYKDDLADCCFNLGFLHGGSRNAARAEKQFQNGLVLWEGLLETGTEPAWLSKLGRTYLNLSLLAKAQDRDEEAARSAVRAAELFEELKRSDPVAASEVAEDHVRVLEELRGRHRAAGEFKDALAFQDRLAAVLRARAAEEPGEPGHLRRLALGYADLARWHGEATRKPEYTAIVQRRALDAWGELAEAHPGPEAAFGLANTYFELGHVEGESGHVDGAEESWRRAVALLKPLTRSHPEQAEYRERLAACYHQLGNLYAQTGRLDEAEAAYQKALLLREGHAEAAPDDAAAATSLGGLLVHLGDLAREQSKPQSALAWYGRALETLDAASTRPDLPAEAVLLLARARTGQVRAEAARRKPVKSLPGTQASFERRLAGPPPRFAEPADPFPVEIGGGLKAYQAGHFSQVLEALNHLLVSHPAHAGAWSWKARTLGRLGRYPEAIKALERVLALAPDHAPARHDKADVLRFLGLETEALRAVEDYLNDHRQESGAWFLQGLVLGRFLNDQPGEFEPFDRGRNDRAIAAFDKALLLDPNDIEARFYKGLALYQGSLVALADCQALQEQAAREMDEETARDYLRPHQRAFRCYFQRALESFDHAIRLRPEDGRGWYHKGRLLLDLEAGHEAAAEDAFRHAVERQPGLADAWLELARMADRRQDRKQARALINKAIEANPEVEEEARATFLWLSQKPINRHGYPGDSEK